MFLHWFILFCDERATEKKEEEKRCSNNNGIANDHKEQILQMDFCVCPASSEAFTFTVRCI